MNLKNRRLKIERLQFNLDGITKKIDSMVIQQRAIKSKLNTEKSKFSIELNDITIDDIIFVSKDSKKFIGHFDNLENHLLLLDRDKYCEFNGYIFLINDAIEHKFNPIYGNYEDLK